MAKSTTRAGKAELIGQSAPNTGAPRFIPGSATPQSTRVGRSFFLNMASWFSGNVDGYRLHSTSAALPSTFQINQLTSIISGIASATYSGNLVVEAYSLANGGAFSSPFSLLVDVMDPPLPATTGTLTLPDAVVGQFYSFSLAAHFSGGGPVDAYLQSAGPDLSTYGLTVDAVTGNVSGMPTIDADLTGLCFSAVNASGPAHSAIVSLKISPAVAAVSYRIRLAAKTKYMQFTSVTLNAGDSYEFIFNVTRAFQTSGDGNRPLVSHTSSANLNARIRILDLNSLSMQSAGIVTVVVSDPDGSNPITMVSGQAQQWAQFANGLDHLVKVTLNSGSAPIALINQDFNIAGDGILNVSYRNFTIKKYTSGVLTQTITYVMNSRGGNNSTENSLEGAGNVMTYKGLTAWTDAQNPGDWESFTPNQPAFNGNTVFDLGDGVVGQAISYDAKVHFTNVSQILGYERDGVWPAGVDIHPTTGIVTGNLTTAATYSNYRVKITFAGGTAYTNFDTMTVTTPSAPSYINGSFTLPNAIVGQPWAVGLRFCFNGTPTDYDQNSGPTLPAWINFNKPAGLLYGTPGPGDVTTLSGVSFKALNAAGEAVTPTSSLAVKSAVNAPTFSGTVSVPAQPVGVDYPLSAAFFDFSPYFTDAAEYWVGVGNMPVGMWLDKPTAKMYGKRVDSDPVQVTIVAINPSGRISSNLFTLTAA